MKKIILISFLLINSILSFSQYISLDELVQLRTKNWSEINDLLQNKGWEFYSSNDGKNESEYNIVTWNFSKDSYNSEQANSWLTYYYQNEFENQITFQTVEKEYYNRYMSRIKALNLKKINSEISSNKVSSDYQGKTVVIKLSIIISEDKSTTSYIFHIIEKKHYLSLRKNQVEIKQLPNNLLKVGDKIWMNYNLNVIKFQNEDEIKYASNIEEWKGYCLKKIPCYCYPNFDKSFDKECGLIYNFYAILDSRNIVPFGFHMAKSYEWHDLIINLGALEGDYCWYFPKDIFFSTTFPFHVKATPELRRDNTFSEIRNRACWIIYGNGIIVIEITNNLITYLTVGDTYSKNINYQGYYVRCVKD